MAKKNLTTPKGVAVFPHLSRPDTKFNKDGVWHTKIKLEGADATALIKQIADVTKTKVVEVKDELMKKAKEKGKTVAKVQVKLADPPYKAELDDEENPTGATVFTFKMNAKGKNKAGEVFERQPAIFDKSGTPVQGLKIGGGSVIRISYQLNPFYTAALGVGCSLRLYAVQVVELVEFGGNAEYFGFDDESGEEEVTTTSAKTAGTKTDTDAAEAEDSNDF